MSWLVKVKHYGGGESVVARHESRALAELTATIRNDEYHTDNYYAEECDPTRARAFLAKRDEINQEGTA